jgi:hypothetical protein
MNCLDGRAWNLSDHSVTTNIMIKIPKKVTDRFSDQIKKFQAIALSHKSRDVSEADTVTLVKDILADVFGYDKYSELTSEQQIKGTFCDLAVKLGDRIKYLVEVKAAGVTLNDAHLRQSINYGANQGIEWIVLTNSLQWKLHRIKFAQPVETEEVCAFDITTVNLRNEDDLRKLFLFCREGISGDAMDVFHQHALLLNRYTVAQVLLLDPVLAVIRRELRRIFPDIKVDVEQIGALIRDDIMKREVVEGDKVAEAATRIRKALKKTARVAAKSEASSAPPTTGAEGEETSEDADG